MKTKTKTAPAAGDISQKRHDAAQRAMFSRWGAKRSPSRTIRVDEPAYNALQRVPEKYRREVASRAIEKAADDFTPPTT